MAVDYYEPLLLLLAILLFVFFILLLVKKTEWEAISQMVSIRIKIFLAINLK